MQNPNESSVDLNMFNLLGIPPIALPQRPRFYSWEGLPPRARERLREGEEDHKDAIVPGEVRVMELTHVRSGETRLCQVSYLNGALVVKTPPPKEDR